METLTVSSAKLVVFVENQNLRDKYHNSTSFLCRSPTTRDAAAAVLIRPEIGFLGYLKKHVNIGFSPSSSSSLSSVSFHRKTIHPVSSSFTETCAALEEILTKDITQFKTVHVKFQLQKECSFGQQFLMVGDDPMFGFWDPSNAIPLNWSEGHVWTVEMDIPCDKVMKYKFILKSGDDTILWQPGPDRILQTWETGKTITVCEDWDNAALQTIVEEDPVTHQLTESKVKLEELMITDNLLQPSGKSEELASSNGYSKPMEKPLPEKPMAIVAENTTEQNGGIADEINGFSGASFTSNPNEILALGLNDYQNSVSSGSSENLIAAKDEKNLDSGATIPVLAPGLTPIPTAEIEEASVSKADKQINTETQEFNVPEITA
ncbi:hypothetical protein ACH5RR_004965 [Cinchona calisaya]|uniref:CBM20 domain-containing protein n=1 Tax=Cinchona calisaya TaxID=153742 RepID=A0ABD3AZ35_9GENT